MTYSFVVVREPNVADPGPFPARMNPRNINRGDYVAEPSSSAAMARPSSP
jgi:hypothetical protein